MKNAVKGKNIKWWIGTAMFAGLFILIGTFAYAKMDSIWSGVRLHALIKKNDTSPLIVVNGTAKNAIYLSLNGREIFIDTDGNFSEDVSLLPGLSVMTLYAEDKFGNVREKKMEVMYEEERGAVAVGDTIINTN